VSKSVPFTERTNVNTAVFVKAEFAVAATVIAAADTSPLALAHASTSRLKLGLRAPVVEFVPFGVVVTANGLT
jgi:hypothetical protein